MSSVNQLTKSELEDLLKKKRKALHSHTPTFSYPKSLLKQKQLQAPILEQLKPKRHISKQEAEVIAIQKQNAFHRYNHEGLKKAYDNPENRLYFDKDNKTLFIAGTIDFPKDHLTDLLIPMHLTPLSGRFRDADKFLKEHEGQVDTLVGHSYGSSVTDSLNKAHFKDGKYQYKTVTYASPHAQFFKPKIQPNNFRHKNDLISFFDRSATTLGDHGSLFEGLGRNHSHGGYEITIPPHLLNKPPNIQVTSEGLLSPTIKQETTQQMISHMPPPPHLLNKPTSEGLLSPTIIQETTQQMLQNPVVSQSSPI